MPTQQQQINYGNSANDGQGDPLRSAFIKTDDNFDAIWAAGPVGSNVTILNTTIATVSTNGNLILKPNGIGIVQANSHILPNTANIRDLGSSTQRWRTAYSQSVNSVNLTASGEVILPPVSDITIPGGTNGYVLQTDGTGNLSWTAQGGAGNGNPGGANTEIQFNDAGTFGGDADFTYNKNTNVLNLNGTLTALDATVYGAMAAVTMSASGNATANYFIGNGSQLTGITTSYGDSNVTTLLSNLGSNVISGTGNITTTANVSGAYVKGNGSALTNLPAPVVTQDIASNGAMSIMLYDGTIKYNNYATVEPASGNITGGNISTTGNVTANYFIGDGSQLTNLPGGGGLPIANGTSNFDIATANGNATVTTAGTYTWTFDTTGNLNLPAGGTILESTYFSAGSIRLRPNGGSATQYLEIAPTAVDGDHVHLMAGGGNTELFLGDDNQYVKLANTGNIVINSNDGAGNSAQWQFGANGTLTVPATNVVPGQISTQTTTQNEKGFDLRITAGNTNGCTRPGGDMYLSAGVGYNGVSHGAGNVNIITGDRYGNLTGSIWQFDALGNLTVPGNIQTISTGFPFSSNIGGINTGSPTVIVTLTDAVFGAAEIGQVTISGVVGTTQANDTWYYASIDPSNFVLYNDAAVTIPVNGNTWTAYISGGLAVSQGYSNVSIIGGNVNIVTNTGNTWTFGGPQSDALYWPDGSFQATAFVGQAIDLVNPGNASITSNSTGNTTYVWTFGDDGRLTFPGTPRIDTDSDNFEVQAAESISLEANAVVNIYTDSSGNAYQWQFGDDGLLTFPDNLVIAGNTSVFGTNRALIQPSDDLPLIVLSAGANGAVSSIWVEDIANVGTSNIAAVYANPVPGSGNVRIVVGQNGVGSGPNLWDFDTAGNLILPSGGNLIVSGAIVSSGASPAPYISGFSSITLSYGAVIRDTSGDAVAFGQNAGNTSQGSQAVAIGQNAGANSQAAGAVAVGVGAGQLGQGITGIAIGDSAGYNTQGPGAVAIGAAAGFDSQGEYAVALGYFAGNSSQGNAAVAVGAGAGVNTQGVQAVAIGTDAGTTTQGNRAVAIGYLAGSIAQGNAAVAIGYYAGELNQGNNSIIINATGTDLQQTTANTFTVAPVRNDVANIGNVMFYNATSKEITYGNVISVTGNVTGNYILGNGSQLTSINAVTVDITDTNGLTTVYYPTFVENRTTAQIARADVDLTYRTDDNLLTVGNVSVTGNVTGGNLSLSGNITGNTAGFAIGYRDIPQVSLAANVTTALTDAGKHYYSTSASNLALTIANNTSVSWSVGTAISIVNRGTANITIAGGTGVSLYLAGNSTAGNRTVTTYGMATVMNVAANIWMISGTVV